LLVFPLGSGRYQLAGVWWIGRWSLRCCRLLDHPGLLLRSGRTLGGWPTDGLVVGVGTSRNRWDGCAVVELARLSSRAVDENGGVRVVAGTVRLSGKSFGSVAAVLL
jgi:hypothetical protein